MNKTAFRQTYTRFKESLDCYPYDLNNYYEWEQLPADLKAIGLYVQFYDQIHLAYRKNKIQYPYIEEETAVSTVIQYLMKNVDKIIIQKDRYCPAYIYQISFNAIYALGRIKRDIGEYENTIPLIDDSEQQYEDDSYTPEDDYLTENLEQLYDNLILESEMYDTIKQLNIQQQKIIERIYNGYRPKPKSPKLKELKRIFDKYKRES